MLRDQSGEQQIREAHHRTVHIARSLLRPRVRIGGIEEARQSVLQQGYPWEQYEPLVVCSPADMRMALHYLEERYGGITAYVRTIGLSELEIARLRAALVI